MFVCAVQGPLLPDQTTCSVEARSVQWRQYGLVVKYMMRQLGVRPDDYAPLLRLHQGLPVLSSQALWEFLMRIYDHKQDAASSGKIQL